MRLKTNQIKAFSSNRSVVIKDNNEHTIANLETIRAENPGTNHQGPLTAVDNGRIGMFDYNTNDSLGHALVRGLPRGATSYIGTGPGRLMLDFYQSILSSDELVADFSRTLNLYQAQYNKHTLYANYSGIFLDQGSSSEFDKGGQSLNGLALFTDTEKFDNMAINNPVSAGNHGAAYQRDGKVTFTNPGVWQVMMRMSHLVFPGGAVSGVLPVGTGFTYRLRSDDDSSIVAELQCQQQSDETWDGTANVSVLDQSSLTYIVVPYSPYICTFELFSGQEQLEQQATLNLMANMQLSATRVGPTALSPVDDATAES